MSSTAETTARTIDLNIGGMTCASCAARIEKKLNRMDGVSATVNFATETARVVAAEGVSQDAVLATVVATGYTAAVPEPHPSETIHDGPAAELLPRLIISAILAVPVLVLAMVSPWQFPNWQWVVLALASPVAIWGAWPFHRAAVMNARHGSAGMDTLISIGVLAAYLWSLYSLLFTEAGDTGMQMPFRLLPSAGGGDIYLEVASTVTVFLLAGRYAEARAKHRAGDALRALLALGAKDVGVLRDGIEVRLPVDDLRIDDTFVVRPGETIATDGTVIGGSSAVDASMLTGESVPEEVSEGSGVVGGTVNVGGRLLVRATGIGADTQLARMGALVTAAQSGKAPVQRLANRISAVFVPVVLVVALLTLAGWLLWGPDVQTAFTAAVSVLIIACPCALGLATPTALLVGTGRGAQIGVLIRGPQILESTRRIDTIVLDKTGTLTTGVMTVTRVHTSAGWSDADLLQLAGAVEDASEHPIGRAISTAARSAGPLSPVEQFQATPAGGVRGLVGGRAVVAGRASWLAQEWSLPLSAQLDEIRTRSELAGRTVVVVAADGAVAGLIEVGDQLRPTSVAAVAQLRRLGLEPVMVTGDNPGAAQAVADAVGITRVFADVRPEGKASTVAGLRADGHVVAMVGDGVNDAPALATADLGMALGSGTDAAIEAADITVVRPDLRLAGDAIRLSRATLRIIKQNLFWAFAYNVAAIPLAIAGLASPLLAGFAMAASSVLVVGNSLRLRRFAAVSR